MCSYCHWRVSSGSVQDHGHLRREWWRLGVSHIANTLSNSLLCALGMSSQYSAMQNRTCPLYLMEVISPPWDSQSHSRCIFGHEPGAFSWMLNPSHVKCSRMEGEEPLLILNFTVRFYCCSFRAGPSRSVSGMIPQLSWSIIISPCGSFGDQYLLAFSRSTISSPGPCREFLRNALLSSSKGGPGWFREPKMLSTSFHMSPFYQAEDLGCKYSVISEVLLS